MRVADLTFHMKSGAVIGPVLANEIDAARIRDAIHNATYATVLFAAFNADGSGRAGVVLNLVDVSAFEFSDPREIG